MKNHLKILSALVLGAFAFAPVVRAEEMKTYYPNGKVQMETNDREMKTYYENGQLMSLVQMENGNPVGVSKQFYEDGKLMREEDHATGKWKQYDPNGKLVAEGKV